MGFSVAWLHERMILPLSLPDTPVISSARIQGIVDSIPIKNKHKTQFILKVNQYNRQPANARIQLVWYQKAPEIKLGQQWHLAVKLKKPKNFSNPGSFDYKSSLAKHHIFWTGYVLNQQANQLIKNKPTRSWLTLREKLACQINRLATNETTAGIIEALSLNLTTHINKESWDLFRRTGTIHLFGISGEHIALVSGLIYGLSHFLWTRSAHCCLFIPAPYFAGFNALIAGFLYSLLAGFEPPAQRALIGCFFYTLFRLGKKRYTSWQTWRYALIGVLCFEPHALWMQGFYFSFLAVACLLLTHQRWQLQGYKNKLALQLSCLLGLMPLTLYWYAYGSVNGFVANLFAIPLVGFLIVPLSLLFLLLSFTQEAHYLMPILSWLIHLLIEGLTWTEYLEALNIHFTMQSIGLVLALMGALFIWTALPIQPFKWMALLWLLLPCFPPHVRLGPGEALVHILDVGQGLAVAVHTQKHHLLYDTGDQYYGGNDLGKMVILPYLKSLGVQELDTVVISHPDKDHRGGLQSVEEGIKVNQLLVNNPHYYTHGKLCHDYPPWQWDNVGFRFLAINKNFKNKNNNSCILQISTPGGSLLLPGDIEHDAEDYLVKKHRAKMASEVLVVPHHGSKTSSSLRFLLEVNPHYAIAALGFANRFHFPHAKTLANMKLLGIDFYRTDECGMTEVFLPAQGPVKEPICMNRHHAD